MLRVLELLNILAFKLVVHTDCTLLVLALLDIFGYLALLPNFDYLALLVTLGYLALALAFKVQQLYLAIIKHMGHY